MDKLQRKRMAEREFVSTDPEQAEITYSVQVSMGKAWLHREVEHEWDNEMGTGNDRSHDCWTMSIDDLKKFVEGAMWAIEKSEAFEKAHPIDLEEDRTQ